MILQRLLRVDAIRDRMLEDLLDGALALLLTISADVRGM